MCLSNLLTASLDEFNGAAVFSRTAERLSVFPVGNSKFLMQRFGIKVQLLGPCGDGFAGTDRVVARTGIGSEDAPGNAPWDGGLFAATRTRNRSCYKHLASKTAGVFLS